MVSKRKKGGEAETFVLNYLIRKEKFKKIAQNSFHKIGEIDLILEDITTKEIVFIEVRSHYKKQFYDPLETIDPIKLEKVITASEVFMYENNIIKDFRIDIITVVYNKKGLEIKDWIKNAGLD